PGDALGRHFSRVAKGPRGSTELERSRFSPHCHERAPGGRIAAARIVVPASGLGSGTYFERRSSAPLAANGFQQSEIDFMVPERWVDDAVRRGQILRAPIAQTRRAHCYRNDPEGN